MKGRENSFESRIGSPLDSYRENPVNIRERKCKLGIFASIHVYHACLLFIFIYLL